MKLLLQDLSAVSSGEPYALAVLRLRGFGISESARTQGMSEKRVRRLLRDIAKALLAPTPCIQMSGDVPGDFFKDLFFGNYDPDEGPQSEEARRHKEEILSCQREIHAAVPPDLWEQIDRSYSLRNLRETDAECPYKARQFLVPAAYGG